MVKHRILLTSALVVVLSCSSAITAAHAAPACPAGDVKAGTCATATATDREVTLEAGFSTPGGGTAGGPGAGTGTGSGAGSGTGTDTPSAGPGGGVGLPNGFSDRLPLNVTVTGPATLADIASFRPTPGVAAMEPDGWMVVGLHTNFFARAGTHVVSGVLFDRPAEVRFTPVGYRWDYGDGTTRALAAAGGTWAALGVSEFNATPASHVYDRAGTYTIRMTVLYSAHYRWDDPEWFVVRGGALAVPANELTATAGSARTVLVARNCLANPAGPGCGR